MTVNTTNITSGPYIGNGVTDTYAYNFRVKDKTQLKVFETDTSGNETELTVDTDYTVSGVGNDAGGTITRTAGALPTDYTWYIRANYSTTQETALPSQGPFFPDVHEDAFDKLTFLVQQLYDLNSRSFRISESESDVASIVEVPPVAQRANKVISFDPNGVMTMVQELGNWRGNWATATSYGLRDMFLDTASNTIYFTVQAHTSDTIANDVAAGKIEVLLDGDPVVSNTVKRTSATGSAKMPTGTTAQRDATPAAGYLRFNSDYGRSEEFDGTNWKGLGGASGAGGDAVFYENDLTVDNDYTITTGKNAMSAGPVTVSTGVTVTVPTGSTWTVV